jgi:hypothetical protein
MVEIIQEYSNKRPSFLEGLMDLGMTATGAMGQRYMQQEQQKAQQMKMQKENDRIKELTGMDLSGIQDPKIREKAVELAMQNQGQQDLFSQKKDMLSGIFRNNQNGSKEFPQGTPENITEQENQFNPANISDADIAQVASLDPNLGRELRYAKDAAIRNKQQERKISQREKEHSPEHIRDKTLSESQAKADSDYDKELQTSAPLNEIKTRTLGKLKKLNLKNVTGKPYEKFLEKSGLINLTSEGRREFSADVKHLITDIRSILGGQFSNFEFQTILNAYPSADFSKEANAAIINNLEEFQDLRNKEFEIANNLKKEYGGIPKDFRAKVNERLREYSQSRMPQIKENTRKIMNEEYGIKPGFTLMFDPQGEPLNVSESDVDRYLELGATIL